jgi:hypothetical protein
VIVLSRTVLSTKRQKDTINLNLGRILVFCEGMTEKQYLVFDCDDPPNVQKVILQMLGSESKFELLVSNYLFEVWLLMHFENVETKMTKRAIYNRLTHHLTRTYKKASQGIIREIIQNGNVEAAISNAEELEAKYKIEEKDITSNIGEMNPYTNMHILIEQLMAEIS